MTRSAAPRCSTTSRSSRPTRRPGNVLADLALDPFGAAAEVADPRRAAGRAARRERRRPAAVMAAQRRPGLVVDERPLAVGAGLDVAAVAAQDDRRGPAPVEDEDRLLACRRVEAGERRRQRARQQPALPGRQLRTQVDDLDGRRGADRRAPAGRPGRTRPLRARPTLSTAGVADPRTTAAPASAAERDRHVARLEPRRPVALVGRVVLLVDDDRGRRRPAARGPRAASRRRCRRRRPGSAATRRPARPRRGPNGRSATRASRSARSRSTSGSASAISGTSTSAGRPASSDVGDRLDVDRGLAAAGDAVEQERSRVARRDRRPDALDGLGLGGQQVAGRRPAAAPTGRSVGERSARALADLGLGEAAPDEPGDRTACRGGRPGRPPAPPRPAPAASSASASTCRGPSGRPGGRSPAASDAARLAPGLGQRGSSARSAARRPAPSSVHSRLTRPSRLERPEATQEARPAVRGRRGRGPAAARARAGRGGRRRRRRRRAVAPRPSRPGRQLGDELEPLEQPGRQHRPQDERRRRQVVRPRSSGRAQGQRRAGAARRRGRGRRSAWRADGRDRRTASPSDDPERLPPPELDEDRLAGLEVGERLRDEVRVGPVAAAPAASTATSTDARPRRPTGSSGHASSPSVAPGQGDRG